MSQYDAERAEIGISKKVNTIYCKSLEGIYSWHTAQTAFCCETGTVSHNVPAWKIKMLISITEEMASVLVTVAKNRIIIFILFFAAHKSYLATITWCTALNLIVIWIFEKYVDIQPNKNI